MNLIKDYIVTAGTFQGTPTTVISLPDEPEREWIEEVPYLIKHTHIVVDSEPLRWNLDDLLFEIGSKTAMSVVQVIDTGLNPIIGETCPDYLSVTLPNDRGLYLDASLRSRVDEVIFAVTENLVWEEVLGVAQWIADFTLSMAFVPQTDADRKKAFGMATEIATEHPSLGIPIYCSRLHEYLGGDT